MSSMGFTPMAAFEEKPATPVPAPEAPPIVTESFDAPPALLRAPVWGFWATLGFGLLVAISIIVVQVIVVALWPILSNGLRAPLRSVSSGLVLAVAGCAYTPVAVALCWLFAWLRRGIKPAQYLGFRLVSVNKLLPWALGFLVLILASDAITHFLGRPLVPEVMVQAYRSAGFRALFWFAVVIAAPVSEETLFRGFLFEGFLRSPIRGPGAIVLTSLFWSAIHVQYDLYGMATIFVSGVLLGLVRLRTGSLLATMFLHALMNTVATIETEWILRHT